MSSDPTNAPPLQEETSSVTRAAHPSRADHPAALRRLLSRLSSATPRLLNDTLREIAEEACKLIEAASVAVALFAETPAALEFAAVGGENTNELVGLQIRAEDSLAGETLRTGQPSLFHQQSAGQQSDAEPTPPPKGERLAAVSAAVVPLHAPAGGRLTGALIALNKRGATPDAAFTPEDLDLLTLFAEVVRMALAEDADTRLREEQARELGVLYDAAHTISASLNVQEVITSVLDAICEHLPYQAAVLFLLNDERTHLFIAADRGMNEDDREIQLAADGRVTAKVLENGQPLLLADTDAEPGFDDLSLSGEGQARTRSAMVAPIRSRNDTLGLVIVTSTQPNAYRRNDLNLLSAVASQAGIAIANAYLYEDATRRAEEATALYDLSQHVNATLHLDRVYQFVADSVLNLLKVDKFALLLMDRAEERLVTRISRGVDAAQFAQIRPRVGEGIAGWVYEWMSPTAVADVAADARNRTAPLHTAGVTSLICVPMAVGDEVIGTLLAMSSRRRLFTVAEMELLYTVANQAAVAIVNAMLYQDARSKSTEMRRYFHRVARALGSALEAQDVPQLLADLVVEVMRADRCAIYRVDEESVRLHATSHFRSTAPPDSVVPLGEGLTGWVARRGKSLSVPVLHDDPRSRAHGWLARERLTSYLAVPLKSGRRTVGVVEIYTQEPRLFSDEEVKLLMQFARRARVAERLL